MAQPGRPVQPMTAWPCSLAPSTLHCCPPGPAGRVEGLPPSLALIYQHAHPFAHLGPQKSGGLGQSPGQLLQARGSSKRERTARPAGDDHMAMLVSLAGGWKKQQLRSLLRVSLGPTMSPDDKVPSENMQLHFKGASATKQKGLTENPSP